jgi:hypothetical protein
MNKLEHSILKIIAMLRPPIERWIVRVLITAGLLLITNGLQGFSWIVELSLHILKIESEKRLGIDYSIHTINWISVVAGLLLILLGLLLHYLYKKIELNFNKPKKLFLSIIHKSIDDFIKPKYSKLDNFKIENYLIQEIEIDQTMIYKNGKLEHPEASLFYQNDILSKIRAFTNNYSDFEIAYFGLAHIPLIWDLGMTIADKFPINYYEYNRQSSSWKKLITSINTTENFINVDKVTQEDKSINAIIKIEISYEIENMEIHQVVDNHKYLTTIKIKSIGLDKIKSLNQIDSLTKCFRKAVDNIIKDSDIENIHIFYSGPVSLAFSLSRKVSKRTDPNFIIYNYTRSSIPKYKWAVKISTNNPEIIKH